MKLKLLQKQLAQQGLDAVLILNSNSIDPNLFYFTGMELERAALLMKRNSATLFVPKLEVWRAEKESVIKNVVELPKKLEEFSKKYLFGNVGANLEFISANSAKKLRGKNAKLADASKLISKLREVKTEEETARIRKACGISDEIIAGCISEFRKFRSEGDAKKWLKKATIDKGCELSFSPIVASGKNAALPHYSGEEKLRKGFCVIDFGVKYDGYCSDTTRTIFIGKPTEKEKLLYKTLLNCQEATSAVAQAGTNMEELENFSRKYLGSLEKQFIHRLGHSVGIEVHDPLEKTTKLEEGMVVTIEPGVYFKGNLGIGIEDTVLVKKGRCENLTKVPKELHITL